jgi:nucleoside-triphosphatase THEP1
MILLLSGPSGSGKSTACAALHHRLISAGISVGGVLCTAVFENGLKVGIDAGLIGSGQAAVPLAREREEGDRRRVPFFDPNGTDSFTFGMWHFNAATLHDLDCSTAAWLDKARDGAWGADGRSPVVIVDEIGPLEIVHGLGFMQTLASLDLAAGSQVIRQPVCIVTARPDIAVTLQGRWPGARVVHPSPSGWFDVDSMLALMIPG